MNKTGSSAIQAFLVRNEAVLRELGYLYPETGRVANAHFGISGCLHIGVNPPIQGRVLSSQQIKNCLLAEIDESGCDQIIVSSEYFVLCQNPEIIKRFFNDWKISVIVYLRRHDEWVESLYSQGMQSSPVSPVWGDSIEAFVAYISKKQHQEFNYWELLQPWAKIFGRADIVVRPYEKEQFRGGNICSDFLSTINITDIASFQISSQTTNASPDNDTLFILDRIARMDIPEQSRKQLFSWFLSHRLKHQSSLSGSIARQHLLSPDQRAKLIRHYEPCYRKVAETFLERSDGRLFFSHLPDPNEPWQACSGPDTASILHYSNIVFDQLIQAIALLQSRVAKLEKQDEVPGQQKVE